MHITPDSLKEMAASTVACYRKDSVPLNDSIMKIAMDNELNSDQVKRLVETSNQMAYLSELEDQDDRTFEFDVANYDDIMDKIVSNPELEKEASYSDPMALVQSKFSNMEKVATEKEATFEKWGKGEKIRALKKVAEHARTRLDELKNSEHDSLVKLAQHRAIICRDPKALEKMAKFDNQLELTRLVFGHEKVATDVRCVWPPEQLADIKACSDRLQMMKSAQEEISSLTAKVEKADGIIKEAFLAAAAGQLGRSSAGQAFKSMAAKAPEPIKQKTQGIRNKGKKAYNTFNLVDSTREVGQGTNRKYDAWSSLRG